MDHSKPPPANSFPFYESYKRKDTFHFMSSQSSTRTDWHEAIFCAVQIDLRDYSHLLEYKKEHYLSDNKNRIDMLVIKKQTEFKIPKHIASIFRTHNIFEMKGLGSSLSTDAYYKTNGHAGYYIDLYPEKNALDRHDISLTFPTFHYPKKLFSHLTKECNKTIENPFPGVYYINKEMYATQILVISELSPEDSLYLHCLAKTQNNPKLISKLTKDCDLNKNNTLYTRYMNQFFYSHMKGESTMVCEGVLRYFGTSSEEIAEKTREQEKKIYLPQIEKLTSENQALKQLLAEHEIAY